MRLNFGDLIFRQPQIVALATPPVGGRVESKPRVKRTFVDGGPAQVIPVYGDMTCEKLKITIY